MKTILDCVELVLRFVMTALFAILIVPVTLQIISRYVDFVPRYIWTEEIARFCFIWIIMIGAMIAVRHDSHFDVDLLPRPKSEYGVGLARAIVHLTMLLVAICFIYYGIEFTNQGLMQTSEIADLPMVTIYIAWPLAGVVWTMFLLEKLIEDFAVMRGLKMPYQESE
ncbi:MAG: TRAP transporter small permease [Hyphomicrobiaceae bacterium]